jgi:hypothetical protein
MTSNELNAAYAEQKRIQDLQRKTPTDSNLIQQLKTIEEKIDKLEQVEKVGKYQAVPQ